MSEHALGRRQLVRTAAGVAAGGALAVGTGVGPASASSDDSGHGLLGAWWVEHSNNPPAEPEPGVTVVAFAAGGVVVSTDIRPAGGTSTGTWTSEGNRFRATIWGAIPSPAEGDPGASYRLRVRGRLHDGMISGTFTVTVYAGDGTTVLFEATGSFSGTRLKP